MGKQRGRDEDVNRQSPFTRNGPPEIQMTPSLAEVLEDGDSFFHSGQQSNKMLQDNSRRMRMSHELQRRSFVNRLLDQGVDIGDIPPMEVDVNSSVVTVTMQIYHEEYSELFQKRQPDNLSSIMKDTATLIRFPDPDDERVFACQVSITGRMPNVENARMRLRNLCHLSITFPFEENKHGFGPAQISEWIDKQYKDNAFPCSKIIVRPLTPPIQLTSDKPSINVLGTSAQENEILATIKMITEQLFLPKVAGKLEFFTELSVPTSQAEMYLGGEKAPQLLAVAKSTNASLHFLPNPDPKRRFYHFFITGKPEAITTAFKMMTALQPVQLSLNIRNEDLSFSFSRGEIWKQFSTVNSVHISVCPSSLQPMTGLDSDPVIHFFCFTAQEHNMVSCYEELMKSLRRDCPLVDLIPLVQTPAYIEPVRSHIGDISKCLDIINRGQPVYMSFEGHVDIPSPSYSDAENVECDSVEDLEILSGDMPAAEGDCHPTMPQQYQQGFRPRDDRGGRRHGGSSRSSVDERSETTSYNRTFNRQFSGSFRGNRCRQMSGGDRRGNYYGGRGGRFDRAPPRDREVNVKSELQLKPKNHPTDSQQLNTAGKNYVFSAKEGGDHIKRKEGYRGFRGNHHRHNGSDSYMNYYSHPNSNWRSHNEKVFLKNRTPELANREQDVPSPTESRRMNAMDLIKQASGEQPALPEDHDSASRATYAEILEGNPKRLSDSKSTESSKEVDHKRRQKSAHQSRSAKAVLASSNGPNSSYPSSSPFASDVKTLDRRVDVDHILFSLNCTKYIESFEKAEIKNLRTFSELEEKDLIRLGVGSELDRKTILSYAVRLRPLDSPEPVNTSHSDRA